MFTIRFKGKVQGESVLEQEQTLLVAARRGKVELPHRCGGHARCGTCRVTVEEGAEHLSPVGAAERRVLDVLKAGAEDRLACQAWAQGEVSCRVEG